ncbi:MAG TPA: hypothetical protein VGR01_19740 [Burkholderiales bacterium]|nr:hypothetical protein [Burkholderiales bacterium]
MPRITFSLDQLVSAGRQDLVEFIAADSPPPASTEPVKLRPIARAFASAFPGKVVLLRQALDRPSIASGSAAELRAAADRMDHGAYSFQDELSKASDLGIDVDAFLASGQRAMVFMMPSRVIRGDDLLESPRYMERSDEEKVFFNHVMYSADDFGLLSLAPLRVRRLFNKPPNPRKVDHLVEQLAAVDLVRVYVDGEGSEAVRYLFVPRFGQRMKSFRSKCPLPPEHIYADDQHALENFKKFRAQFKKLAPEGGGPAPLRGGRRPDLDLDSISSHLDLKAAVDKSENTADADAGQRRDRYPEGKPDGKTNDQGKPVNAHLIDQQLAGKKSVRQEKPERELIEGKTHAHWAVELQIEIRPDWTAADLKLAVEKVLAARRQGNNTAGEAAV